LEEIGKQWGKLKKISELDDNDLCESQRLIYKNINLLMKNRYQEHMDCEHITQNFHYGMHFSLNNFYEKEKIKDLPLPDQSFFFVFIVSFHSARLAIFNTTSNMG